MKLNKEYKEICKDIINNDQYLTLKNEIHHGSNRYSHSKRVARVSFIMATIFKGNKEATTKAALLHDFFHGNSKDSEELSYLNHPSVSILNAKKYFALTDLEENIIKTHMYHYTLVKKFFPFINRMPTVNTKDYRPTSKEGTIVCLADLLVSIYECLVFEARYKACIYFLFIFNLLNY